jgi:hypothetical protein
MLARLGGLNAVSCNLAIACRSATFVILARLQTMLLREAESASVESAVQKCQRVDTQPPAIAEGERVPS